MVGAFAACSTAPAFAKPPNGKLTAVEYHRMAASQAAIKKGFTVASPNVRPDRKGCLILGDATALLHATRANCLAANADVLTWFEIGAGKCDDAKAASVPIQGLSSAVVGQLVCMTPAYQALSRVTPSLYASDVRLRADGLKRGFAGNCLITLVATKQQLSFEKQYLGSPATHAGPVG